jgi:uncharacterized protein YjbI with pentapeptide repeats
MATTEPEPLADRHISGKDWSYVTLRGADLRRTTPAGADLRGSTPGAEVDS